MSCPLCHFSETQPVLTKRSGALYLSCSNCGAFFLDSKYHYDTQKELLHYQKHQNRLDDSGYRNFLKPLFDAIVDRHPSPCVGLDFGAGPGPALSQMLTEVGYSMSQWDPYFFSDPEVLSKQYDFIICSEVVEHFYNPYKDWEKMKSCLKQGGTLAIMTSLLLNPEEFKDWYYHRDPTHVFFYQPQTLHWLKEKLSFNNLEIQEPRVACFF